METTIVWPSLWLRVVVVAVCVLCFVVQIAVLLSDEQVKEKAAAFIENSKDILYSDAVSIIFASVNFALIFAVWGGTLYFLNLSVTGNAGGLILWGYLLALGVANLSMTMASESSVIRRLPGVGAFCNVMTSIVSLLFLAGNYFACVYYCIGSLLVGVCGLLIEYARSRDNY